MYTVAKTFYFPLVESSEDYINDDNEPAPFVIMPPPSNNTEVNSACKYTYYYELLTVNNTMYYCFVDLNI